MRNGAGPVVKDLVLVGGGHSHVAVLKRFGMAPEPGVRLTLICRDAHTPYSGMLPGLVAGHYEFDEAHIDLGPLCRFAGAGFIHDEATGLDLDANRVLCRDHPPVDFDLISLNVGSTPDANVAGAADNVVPVKPINRFLAHWQGMSERVMARNNGVRIAVVGAGAGGVEILLAADYRLRRLLAERSGSSGGHGGGRGPDGLEFHLFDDMPEILPTHNPRVRQKFLRVLAERSVHVHTGQAIVKVAPGSLTTADGTCHDVDEILWVTAAGAAPWLKTTGLALDAQGFVAVNDALQSISHARVFAAGDVAGLVDHPRPKSGVFAVRQGRPLADNLRRALLGQRLTPFRPQRKFLSLISTGDKYAVASRGRWALEGRYVWRWKDWIDRRFMRKYSEFPKMAAAGAAAIASGLATPETLQEISALAMRCGGCGAKVGSGVLERVLARLDLPTAPDVLIGLNAPDDAAVVEVPQGLAMVHTVDYFRAFIDDPFVFGQVAANHSLGDVYAMGAVPRTALAVATLPFGLESKTEALLFQLLSGALKTLREADTMLVGGHTSEGAELALGFAVNGLVDPGAIMRKGGLRPGDKLILTKAIGTGTLFAADMRGKAKGRWIAAALNQMVQSNRNGAECLRRHGANACTDVTGFGLLGHLVEMVKVSSVDIDLDLDSVPLLDGALDTVRLGILSSLQPQNVRLRRAIANLAEAAADERYPLLFDPQTAGGLLASVAAAKAAACVAELRQLGYAGAAIIGTVKSASQRLESITINR